MSRLAEVKAERDAAKAELSMTQMCLMLALTAQPDHTETVELPGDAFRYIISAYRLTGCAGGYIIVRGVYPGQSDSIRAYLFDTWERSLENYPVEFRIAAERINRTQAQLLHKSA